MTEILGIRTHSNYFCRYTNQQGMKGSHITNFFIAGISYKKIEAEARGQFAINFSQYSNLTDKARAHGITEFFILSTCNRTEIYGFADSSSQLLNLLCSETSGDTETFEKLAYIKSGLDAVQHLYHVGAGLDSQILGDYEIIGQIKSAVKFSKEKGFIGPFFERLVNSVLQSSKAIKNQTQLSGGTVSVSFAAVQYLRENIIDIRNKQILLIGTGKIGRTTCKNLVEYLGASHITLINRTEEKATELAKELGLRSASSEALPSLAESSDIIVIATNADKPILMRSHLEGKGNKMIIDLSVPCNVEKSVLELSTVKVLGVDELSRMKDETLEKRQAEVPRAKVIIAEHLAEFLDWFEMRKHVPVLKAAKIKLKEINSCRLYRQLYPIPHKMNSEEKIQKVINGMASRMRHQNQGGCHYIEAINEYLATGTS